MVGGGHIMVVFSLELAFFPFPLQNWNIFDYCIFFDIFSFLITVKFGDHRRMGSLLPTGALRGFFGGRQNALLWVLVPWGPPGHQGWAKLKNTRGSVLSTAHYFFLGKKMTQLPEPEKGFLDEIRGFCIFWYP